MGNKISDIGNRIQEVAEQHGLYVDDNFCGHGVGRFLHMKPLVASVKNNMELRIEEGMVFTVEPVLML